MGLDDRLHQAQTQAQTPFCATGIAAKQPIEDPRKLVRGNAGACVVYSQNGSIALASNVHVHTATRRRVFDGVVDQVRRDLFEPRPIRRDDDLVGSAGGQGDTLRIGDVARLIKETTVTVRWWQEEFCVFLRVDRSGSAQRVYSSRALETLREIQRLLRVELYTIAGAKRQLRLAAERQKGTG